MAQSPLFLLTCCLGEPRLDQVARPRSLWNLDSAKSTLVDALLKLTFAEADEEQFFTTILKHLAAELSGKSYDTEEREFLTDCVFQIAQSLELADFAAGCNEWGKSGKFQRRYQ